MSNKLVIQSNISKSHLEFKEKNQIFQGLQTYIGSRDKAIISISGGPDSMLTAVLIYNFFRTNKYNLKNLTFVHFNHKLRPESTQEQQFLQTYLKGNNLVCISKAGVLKPEIGTPKNTEQALRNWRYKHLQQLAKKHDINFVFLGHNLSDRIESSFMNLLRGASLKGFVSMNEVQQHHLLKGVQVIRPLLSLGKNYILQICKKNDIPYVVDQSNFDASISLRNKLRNQTLPSLYNLSNSPTGQSTFESSMQKLYTSIEKLNSTICPPLKKERWCKAQENFGEGISEIKISKLRNSKFAYERMIKPTDITTDQIISLLNKLGIYKNISSSLLQELLKFFKSSKDGHKYFNQTYFFIAHNHIYIISAPKDFWKKTINKKIKIGNKEMPFDSFTIKPEKEIEGSIIRYPRSGDKYKNKTLNQYCINQKIPIFRRNFIPVLEKNGKILKVIKPMN